MVSPTKGTPFRVGTVWCASVPGALTCCPHQHSLNSCFVHEYPPTLNLYRAPWSVGTYCLVHRTRYRLRKPDFEWFRWSLVGDKTWVTRRHSRAQASNQTLPKCRTSVQVEGEKGRSENALRIDTWSLIAMTEFRTWWTTRNELILGLLVTGGRGRRVTGHWWDRNEQFWNFGTVSSVKLLKPFKTVQI